MFGLWCNGSTTGFGSVCPSSNLGSPTKEGPEREIFRGFLFRITLMALSIVAQRKIPVDLHFIVRLRHKASGAALGLSCAVCFEQPAGVFAGCGAVCQAKILASLKIKNGISLTPLN